MSKIKEKIIELIAKAAGVSELEVAPTIENAREGFGDVSSKIAFILAKKLGKNPVEIAKELADKINAEKDADIEKIEAAGPYLNFYLSDKSSLEFIKKLSKGKIKPKKKTGKKIVVEFFHANTHKGVHIGHIRNISIGEALSRVFEFNGDKVIRANYQGDIGPHVAKCLWGFINLYKEEAPENKRGEWLGKVYAESSARIKDKPELEEQVKQINLKLYAGDKKIVSTWKKTRQWCLDDFEEFYKTFGVKFNQFYFESKTEKVGKRIVLELLDKGLVKLDQGAIIMDLKDDGLGVFVLITKEGYPLYSAKDIGLAKIKFDKYNPDQSIHVVGKEQEMYFKQLFKTLEKTGFEKIAKASYHLIYELVMLPEGKMSSREGTMVLYNDLLKKLIEVAKQEVCKRHQDWTEGDVAKIAGQIALGALKFTMVRRESNRNLIFNWEEALKLEGDTGPHLQYAYVRTKGILRKADEAKQIAKVSKKYRLNEQEKSMIKALEEFEGVTIKSAKDFAPNYIANYLLDLASTFNKFYDSNRVLNAEKKEEIETRLAIVKATNLVLEKGLELLGISCPEKM